MTEQTIAKKKDLKKYGLKNVSAHWNLDGKTLQKLTVEKGMGTETENGTLCVNTGKFTGRSPKDRFPSDPGALLENIVFKEGTKEYVILKTMVCVN